MLKEAIGSEYDKATFMSCGPQEMMDLARTHAIAHGVTPEHFKTESFAS
jgi:ferredoxin-NADP reductase